MGSKQVDRVRDNGTTIAVAKRIGEPVVRVPRPGDQDRTPQQSKPMLRVYRDLTFLLGGTVAVFLALLGAGVVQLRVPEKPNPDPATKALIKAETDPGESAPQKKRPYVWPVL